MNRHAPALHFVSVVSSATSGRPLYAVKKPREPVHAHRQAISLKFYRKRAPAPGVSQSRFGTWEITGSYGPSYRDC
jgi:hypothetical protein